MSRLTIITAITSLDFNNNKVSSIQIFRLNTPECCLPCLFFLRFLPVKSNQIQVLLMVWLMKFLPPKIGGYFLIPSSNENNVIYLRSSE